MWYSFQQGDTLRDTVAEIVRVHMLRETVTGAKLEANPPGVPHQTFDPDESITLQTLDMSGSAQYFNTSLQEADLDACAEDAVMHKIRHLLLPEGTVLPANAAARTPEDPPGARHHYRLVHSQYTNFAYCLRDCSCTTRCEL